MPWEQSKVVVMGLLLAGAALTLTGSLMAAVEWSYARRGIITNGKVIGIEKRHAGFDESEEHGTVPRFEFLITYQYQDSAGESHIGEETYGSAPFDLGQEKPVQYLSDTPATSRIPPGAPLWLAAGLIVMILGGLGLIAVGVIGLFHKRTARTVVGKLPSQRR